MGKPKGINAKDAADAYKKGQNAARAEAARRRAAAEADADARAAGNNAAGAQ
ncbi:hypothetical protein [Streptomyces scopuliridis]|uniref:Uncharacterized protein n=1 Tax=Streptomyces scopuliridis TaxID=452529 RepID=A0ACD4ZQ22_9ACTN|nr:hypothetical protein [Streptomyces scopuliridis]WSC00084.1 hypothetical protein OG835_25865 [Streptomyces scopuliridis]